MTLFIFFSAAARTGIISANPLHYFYRLKLSSYLWRSKKHPFLVGEKYRTRGGFRADFIGECPNQNYPLVFWHGCGTTVRCHALDGTFVGGPTLGPADILPPEPPLDSHTFYMVVNKNTNERHLTPFKPDYEWHVTIGRVVVHDDGTRIRAVEVDGQWFEIEKGNQ